MKLAGQAREDGYAMAALLVGMAVMAVMTSVAMPVWSRMVQREKEEELVFRGQQYARAIGLFQRKFANAAPPSLDLLVEQKFLRKKYKDPITNDDFVPITQAQAQQPGAAGALTPGSGGQTPVPGSGRAPARPSGTGAAGGRGPGTPAGGIVGVTSKSTRESIRLYNGRNHYNEWQFVYAPPAATPAQGARPGAAGPGLGGRPGAQGRPPGTAREAPLMGSPRPRPRPAGR
ncbi:MAG: type II secretion system protein [Acidobacteria bacterium]|nr:type II secretion system protein [Acidobacteriota bacterium]